MLHFPFRAWPVYGVAALLSCSVSPLMAAFPSVYLKPVVRQQFHSPTTITHAGDGSGRLFVCDQPGRIFIVKGGMMLPVPFLDIRSPNGAVSQSTGYSERGLLGLAFHPGFEDPLSPGYRKFYVNYNKNYVVGSDPAPPVADHTPNCTTVIAEFSVSPTDANTALPASERRLLLYPQPQSNHNGGQLEFGPDGLLYIAAGDGGSSQDNNAGHTGGSTSQPAAGLGNAQNRTSLLGKILRIDPVDPDGAGPLMYSIPSTNPFFNDPAPGIKKEIYAYGLRNPWRFSFDWRPGGTGRLFCGDVGQGRVEEINLIVSGGNYGWRYQEGTEFPSFSSGALTNPMPNPGGTLIGPIAMYAHPGVTTSPVLPQLGLSVTGGFVYRGSAIPAMQGKYVFGDYGSTAGASDGRIMGLEETFTGSGTFTLTQAVPLIGQANPVTGQRILALGEDEAGEIYFGLKTNGGVLQLDGGLPAGGLFKIKPTSAVSRFDSWLATHFPANLTGQYVDPQADPDGDGIKNQIEYAYGFNPKAFDSAAATGFTVNTAPAAEGGLDLTVTFRRDSLATDLTYQLQTASDLTNWATLAQSSDGALATGQNGGIVLSDNTIIAPFQLVTVRQTFPPDAGKVRFVRLKIDRF